MKLLQSIKSIFTSKSKLVKETEMLETKVSQIETEITPEPQPMQDWLTIGSSVIGNSHIANNIPCQDSHFVGCLSDKWGIAVVSDGASSHVNSHHGSSFMVKNIVEVLKSLVEHEAWFINATFPTPKEWRDAAITSFSFVYDNLRAFGIEQEMPIKTLGGTINLLIFSNEGYLSAHIGDGRTAVQYANGQWDSAITPFKGEQAGETVFLTTDYTWEEPSICIESKVIQKPIKSFAILSDGLENYCFYCNVKNENEEKFHDPNKPFEAFFNQNIGSIFNLYKNGETRQEIENKFSAYLKDGHAKISKEADNKTIIFGIKI